MLVGEQLGSVGCERESLLFWHIPQLLDWTEIWGVWRLNRHTRLCCVAWVHHERFSQCGGATDRLREATALQNATKALVSVVCVEVGGGCQCNIYMNIRIAFTITQTITVLCPRMSISQCSFFNLKFTQKLRDLLNPEICIKKVSRAASFLFLLGEMLTFLMNRTLAASAVTLS